ncbi:MAG: AMIN domain-containing protein, partial [Terriglobales bacterium]
MRSRATVFFLIVTCFGLSLDVRCSDQNATPGTLPQFNAVISTIAVRSTPDAVIVEITSSKLVSPEIQTLSNPERLVFDFPGCQLLHPSEYIAVNRGPVLAVRASVFRLDPPAARVVVDLKQPRKYDLQYSGNTLRIKISAPVGAATPPGAATVDRAIPEQAKLAPLSARKAGRPSYSQQHAYGLLAKARTLTVSDLQPLEDRAEA